MTEPTDQEQYLNIADQCATTATNDLAASILVDGGSGTLRELLNDAADAIRAGWAAPQPAQAQAGAVPLTPDEALDAFCHTPGIHQFVQAFVAGVRFAEHHHGIKGGQHDTE